MGVDSKLLGKGRQLGRQVVGGGVLPQGGGEEVRVAQEGQAFLTAKNIEKSRFKTKKNTETPKSCLT